MHSPRAVGHKLLELADQTDKRALTPMKIIKLVYICHGWMLGIYGRPLLNEPVQAWKYGPVSKTLYSDVRHYRDQPIPVDALRPKWECFGVKNDPDYSFDEIEQDVIRQVYEKYGKYDAIALSSMTHQPGTPWDISFRETERNTTISNDLIEHYYRTLYEESRAGSQREAG